MHNSTRRLTASRRLPAMLLSILMLLALAIAGAPEANAATTNRLYAGERLTAGQKIVSDSGKLSLVMQSDGNLVLYAPGSSARWDTNTQDNPGAYATLQTDGNLVVYTAAGKALWNAGTGGSGAAFLQIQDDGNVVLYTAAPRSVWQTGTRYYPSRLEAGQTLAAGQRLQSPNGAFEALMQTDGNFVLYGPGGWTWQSDTDGSGATRLSLQTDGNLVMYTSANVWKWQTRTNGRTAGSLRVQDDGNMVLYDASSTWVWQTYTYPGYKPPTAPTSKARQAIDYATAQLGKPYVYGGTGPGSFDCSGLTMRSWEAAGTSIPRVSRDQYGQLPKVPFAEAKPGDIIAYGTSTASSSVYHVALYIGDGKMIEAPRAGIPVRVTAVRHGDRMPYVVRPAS